MSEVEKKEYESILSRRVVPPESNPMRFLNYVAAKYFNGERDITEHAIAVEALGRRHDFDPKLDPIVRVEAHRLRKRLNEYYEHEGADRPLRMTIPLGSYAPVFVRRRDGGPKSQTSLPPAEAPPDREVQSSGWKFVASGTAGLALLAVLLILANGTLKRSFRHTGESTDVPRKAAAAIPASVVDSNNEIRIAVGSLKPYIDDMGRTWQIDRYFTGGDLISAPGHRISRTLNPVLYRFARVGDFRYDIPLKPGAYELHLHFAETAFGSGLDLNSDGTGGRIFHIKMNGRTIADAFDIISNISGSNTADQLTFKDVSPARDGFLHLEFGTTALLNGIEILPATPGKMRPLRIVCAPRAYHDASGNVWTTDRYFLGGNMKLWSDATSETAEPGLYGGERQGTFTYAVPVAPQGKYGLTLYFAESYFGGARANRSYEDAVGERVFDVYCNGVVLLKDFDILKEAHSTNRALTKTFHDLKPNGQGELFLSFVPVRSYPTVRALEVIDESR